MGKEKSINITISLIMLAVIIIGVVIYLGFFRADSKEFLDRLSTNINPFTDDYNETSEDTPEVRRAQQGFFNAFYEDYQKCKNTPDDNCLCPIRPVNIPEGFFLELTNTGDKTQMSFVRGKIEDGQAKLEERGAQSWKEIQQSDTPQVAYITPGIMTDFVVNNKLDTQPYHAASRIYLAAEFGEGAANSLTKLFTDVDIRGENSYNFRALYKIDETKTAFVPSPDSFLDFTRDQELLQQLNTLRKCRVAEGFNEAKVELNKVKEMLTKCKNLNSASNLKCSHVEPKLPNNFKVTIYPNKLILSQGEKPLAEEEFQLTENSLGICSYPQNTIKAEESSQKSFSQSFEITSNLKRTSVFFTEEQELCLVNYDEAGMEHLARQSLRATI